MSRKSIALLLAAALVAVFFAGAGTAMAAGTSAATVVQADPDPVDADARFKALDGSDARSQLTRAKHRAASELAEADDAADPTPPAQGDVELLYADGELREFTLRAIGGNAEIWVANDLSYPEGDPRPTPVVTQAQVDYLFNEFNDKIYPGATGYYGFNDDRDGTNGIFYKNWGLTQYKTDNPQRMMILVFNIIDEQYFDPTYPTYVAGYFWPYGSKVAADRNMIHIDCRDWENRIGPNGARPNLYEQVFTHEFEHAIHSDHDPDETSWVDEGLADLAPYLIGYGHSRSHIADYLEMHRAPLTVWGGDLLDYGKSYLFQLYLLENFGGPEFVKDLVNEQANGIEGVQNSLAAMGSSAKFDDVYRDWTLANLLDNTGLAGVTGAKLGYSGLDIPSVDTMGMSIQKGIKEYGSNYTGAIPDGRLFNNKAEKMEWINASGLMPYAPNYRTFSGVSPQLTTYFLGTLESGIAAYEGRYELWGNRGDLINTRATLAAPVTLGANAKLSFWANYKTELDWDFAFVQISTDGGSTWVSLANDHTTMSHDDEAIPSAVTKLPGFSGSSGGWRVEEFDLAPYAGQAVLIRFVSITDWASNEDGFFADNIKIADDSGTLFYDDLEANADNWVFTGVDEPEENASPITFIRTTGLATYDWGITFVNPMFAGNKVTYDIFDKKPYVYRSPTTGKWWMKDVTTLNTVRLNAGEVTAVISNHLPEATSFPGYWQFYGDKGTAKTK